jgi:hypothetical protein
VLTGFADESDPVDILVATGRWSTGPAPRSSEHAGPASATTADVLDLRSPNIRNSAPSQHMQDMPTKKTWRIT